MGMVRSDVSVNCTQYLFQYFMEHSTPGSFEEKKEQE